MSKILRMYPIRTTRRKWDIKLYRYHNCTEYCGIKVVNDYEYPEQLLIIDNPNYKNNKCEIESFDSYNVASCIKRFCAFFFNFEDLKCVFIISIL